MKIEAKIFLNAQSGNVLAGASLYFDGEYVVKSYRVVKGPNGPFVSGPSKEIKTDDGTRKFVDIAHPITGELKKRIDKIVLDAYNAALQAQGATAPAQTYNQQPNDCLPF